MKSVESAQYGVQSRPVEAATVAAVNDQGMWPAVWISCPDSMVLEKIKFQLRRPQFHHNFTGIPLPRPTTGSNMTLWQCGLTVSGSPFSCTRRISSRPGAGGGSGREYPGPRKKCKISKMGLQNMENEFGDSETIFSDLLR